MKKIFFLLVLGVLLSTSAFSQKSWNQKTNFSGTARNSSIAFSINGKGYLGLGQNASGTKLFDFFEYDPTNNSWTQKANYPGAGSFAASSFVINGKGYVCFGGSNAGNPQGDLWEYNPTTNSWTQKANFPGTKRYGASWFVINDTAFIMTGSPGGSPYLADVWMYVPATNTWTQKANFTGGVRVHGVGFTVDGIGYFGTGISSSSSATKDVWKYNKAKDTWSKIADIPAGNITGTIAFEIDGRGYLGTGYTLSSFLKDYYEYNPAVNTWTKVDSVPSSHSARGGSIALVINRSAYIGTGYASTTGSGAGLNDLWSYTPKSRCASDFSTEPYSQSVKMYDSAIFIAKSIDTAATYQWQINTGSGFSNVSNGGQYSGAKTKRFAIANVKVATNNGHKFRCVAVGKNCSDTSIAATLTVTCTTLFKTEPTNQTGNNGSSVSFTVASLYSATTFLWQKDDGTGYKDITNSGQYNGFDNDTLTMNDLLYSNTNYKYRCVASYDGCVYTSAAGVLTVTCKSIIQRQPTDIAANRGSKAIFTVGIFDEGTLFQWKFKSGTTFKPLSEAGQYYGTTNDSLVINPTTMSNKNQQYKCVMNYKGCKDSSKIVSLNVLCIPMLSSNPQAQNKNEGEKAMFTVSSTDAAATFNWQMNIGAGFQNLNSSSRITGIDNDTLSISNLTLADNNQNYRCILTSDGCYDTSQTVVLKVKCKTLINVQPKNKSVFVGDNAILSFSVLESTVKLAWQSDVGFGYQNLSDAGQYNGVSNDSLSISNVSLANNNQKFRCLLTLGNCTETTDIVTLNTICKPGIIDQPVNKTATVGGTAHFSVSAALPNTTYKWQTDLGLGFQNLSNAGQFKGANKDTLQISNLTAVNDNQAFRCVLSSGACIDTSEVVTLTVKASGSSKDFKNQNISVFPNPSNGFIYLKINPDLLNNLYKIIDQQGRLIMEGKLTETNTKINIENLASGIYILQTEPTLTRTLIIKQ
jgi:N-acetylneuraminic acid mutarotase